MSRRSGSARLRRTWPQRLLICFNVVCIVGALVAAGSIAYAKRKVDQVDRVVFGNDQGWVEGNELADDAPRNFLLVGADTDDGLDANDPARAGRDATVGGIRSDTIMVVRVDPKAKQARILSFPRDLWVDIPGSGHQRINAALQFGGPQLLTATIKQNFDIDINHYVQVDFAGFKHLVKLLGGVPVWFSTPVRDTQSGLNVETSGCTTLDENGALSYVRARHFRYYDEQAGRWKSDPTSDLGRISRQQDFIKRVLRRAIAQGARNPVKLKDYMDVGVANITLDQFTTPGDLVALAQAFKDFDPNTLQTESLPVVNATRGGAAVLDLQTGKAEPILAQFRGTGRTTTVDGSVDPSTVAVQVLNGSGKQDQAADASSVLASVGFKMQPPNSEAAVPRTEVRYMAGQEEQAALVARYLFADPVLVEDPDAAQITVVTGPDFGAAVTKPRPEADVPVPTTTTTAATTTTTAPAGTGTTATTAPAGSVTTTTVNGYVPQAPPAGESCG